MLEQILNSLRIKTSNDDQDSRRQYERRETDSCVGIVDGITYPVRNWSKGGILFNGDGRTFSVNDMKNITLRFKVADRIVDVQHSGEVLRKSNDKIVIRFRELTQNVERQFNHIVDDYVAQAFANSQR